MNRIIINTVEIFELLKFYFKYFPKDFIATEIFLKAYYSISFYACLVKWQMTKPDKAMAFSAAFRMFLFICKIFKTAILCFCFWETVAKVSFVKIVHKVVFKF